MRETATKPSTRIELRQLTDDVRSRHGAAILWAAIVFIGVFSLFGYTEQFIVGIIVGSIYALGALGLTLIYGILKIPHFAHGDSMMLGAYITFFVLTGTIVGRGTIDSTFPINLSDLPSSTTPIWKFSFGYGFILALLLAVVIAIPLFRLLHRFVYGKFLDRKAGLAIIAVASLGVAIATRGFMLVAWGPTPRNYSTGIRETITLPGGTVIVADQLFIIAVAVILAAVAYVLLFRTRTGKAMRAMADNEDLARASGINTDYIARWTWIAGATLIVVAGTLLALQSQLKPELGFILLLPIFASAILGGVGSPQGALIGGLVVGVASEVAVGLGIFSPGYKLPIAFIILIAVILIRPRGLFGVEV